MQFLVVYPISTGRQLQQFWKREDVLDFARTAERAGFDGIGFTDHPAPSDKWLHHGGHDAFDPMVVLASCAAVTERIRLLTHILVLPYRNPFLTAKAVATLDVMSDGRFTLVTAAGYLRAEYAALGVEFGERNELFDEAIDVMRQIWTEENVNVKGRHFYAPGQTANPKPVQQPHPPIWLGGNSRRARERVAAYGQGWAPMRAPELLAQTARTRRLETNEQLGALLDELWEMVEAAGRKRSEIDIQWSAEGVAGPNDDVFDPDAYLEQLEALREMGVTWVSVPVPSDDPGHTFEALEHFGESVITRLR